MSCTATADHSARCRVAHALQTSNQRVPFLANPLDPDGARHMAALTIMWRVQPSRSRARQVDGSREKVHAESPRSGAREMTILSLWGGVPRVQHAKSIFARRTLPRIDSLCLHAALGSVSDCLMSSSPGALSAWDAAIRISHLPHRASRKTVIGRCARPVCARVRRSLVYSTRSRELRRR